MRILVILLMISMTAWSSDKINYANIYADQLIDQFDHELNQSFSLFSLHSSEIYLKLLAARDYIENHGDHSAITAYNKSNLLLIRDTKIFNEVKKEIDDYAEKIKAQNFMTKEMSENLVVYPSSGPDGNLTGNTYPTNVWSLTFDDGPHQTRTDEVLANLFENNMKASFFVLMRQANLYPEAIDNIIKQDMELALHSYNHVNLDKADEATIEYEVATSKRELEEKFKSEISIFRLPYGAGTRNKMLRDKITKNGLVHIFWNVDTLDWKDKDPQSIYERTIKQMQMTPKRSGIILFHDIHAQTVIASKMVMEYLNQENKFVCTVSEVINYFNQKPQDCLK